MTAAANGLTAATALTTPPAEDMRRAVEAGVARAGVRAGEVVALQSANEPAWVHAYCALRLAGAVVLLVDAKAPATEVGRWLTRAGGGRSASVDTDGTVTVTGPRSVGRSHTAGTVLIPTSGSTGAAKLIARSGQSLQREGRRHAMWAALDVDDRVVAPIPLWHAYALGWLHATLEVGCAFDPVPPDAPQRCTQAVNAGATVLILTPATLRLLLARRGRGLDDTHRLRLVMVGAGAIGDGQEAAFTDILGLGLARNYGTTQTGALFSAPSGAPAGCVGQPLDGVAYRLHALDDTADDGSGRLEVSIDGGDLLDTGDLARNTPEGLVITGRATRSVRRGDRWVALEEVEEVVRACPAVVDAKVSSTPRGLHGAEVLRADVVLAAGPTGSTTVVQEWCVDGLSSHKVPDEFRTVPSLSRSSAGKATAAPLIRPGPADVLIEAAQAYKRSALLYALVETGVLAAIRDEPLAAESLAARLDLDLGAVEILLDSAIAAGLLVGVDTSNMSEHTSTDDPSATADDHVDAIVALEREIARRWVTAEELVQVARNGLQSRRFDNDPPSVATRQIYNAAMHPRAAMDRTSFALSLVRARPGDRMLEITAGPGRYAQTTVADAEIMTIGSLAPDAEDGSSAIRPHDDQYDVVVVCNAVHLAGAGSDLASLLARVAPGGRLLVDDVFLDCPDPVDYRLDWLTHGGLAWPTTAALADGLHHVGFDVLRIVTVGRPPSTLLVATPAVGHRVGRTR